MPWSEMTMAFAPCSIAGNPYFQMPKLTVTWENYATTVVIYVKDSWRELRMNQRYENEFLEEASVEAAINLSKWDKDSSLNELTKVTPVSVEEEWATKYAGNWVLAIGREIIGLGRTARKAWKKANRVLKKRHLTKSVVSAFYF